MGTLKSKIYSWKTKDNWRESNGFCYLISGDYLNHKSYIASKKILKLHNSVHKVGCLEDHYTLHKVLRQRHKNKLWKEKQLAQKEKKE